MDPKTEQLRRFLIRALDDPHGVNAEAFASLHALHLILAPEASIDDIIRLAEEVEGRVFLPEDHNLTPENYVPPT